jgi:negative regulator of replication initiation
MPDGTNIRVSEPVWTYLNSQKRPGESFDDVLRRVLELDDGAATAEHATDWRGDLRDWLEREDVPARRREDVLALAELLRDEGYLSMTLATEEAGVVSEWEWQESKDYLAAAPQVERPDQRTWRWVGVDDE